HPQRQPHPVAVLVLAWPPALDQAHLRAVRAKKPQRRRAGADDVAHLERRVEEVTAEGADSVREGVRVAPDAAQTLVERGKARVECVLRTRAGAEAAKARLALRARR